MGFSLRFQLLPVLLLMSVVAPLLGAETTSLRDAIDKELNAAWQKEKVTPAKAADDAAFVRRVYLDLIGSIPSYDEAKKFLDDTAPDKRSKLVKQLLDDQRFGQNQANVWDQVLFGRNPPGSDSVRKRDRFKAWLSAKFNGNVPMDQWVRALLLVEEEGPELFFVQFQNKPEDLTEAFSKAFLGTQVQCARCHDHPYTKLTQRDFYGMTGFFVRLVVLEQGDVTKDGQKFKGFKIGEKSSGEVMFSGNAKEAKAGKKGDPVKPKFLEGAELTEPALPKDFKEPETKTGTKSMNKPLFSRKEQLAAWATAKENPFFAKAAVNRIWGQLMGRGIVHPVDNLGEDNKPSMPALLDEMTKQFIDHQFDVKWLMGEIVSSKAYQLAGDGPGKDAMPKLHERARVRPLTAEELSVSIRIATADPPSEKPQGDTSEYFLRYFGEPTNGLGDFQGSLGEHLFLNNSDNIRKFISRKKGNLADQVISSSEPWEQRIDRMFLSVLTRLPSPVEREKFKAYLTSEAKPEKVVEEAIWVLLNTSEFRFNH